MAETMTETTDEIITANEVAKYLKIAKSTVYLWMKEQGLPFRKIGRSLRFKKSEVKQWFEEVSVARNPLP